LVGIYIEPEDSNETLQVHLWLPEISVQNPQELPHLTQSFVKNCKDLQEHQNAKMTTGTTCREAIPEVDQQAEGWDH
jgi:hypothetical protein